MSIKNCYKQPILKSLILFYVSLNPIETWQIYLILILLYSQKVRMNIMMFLDFDDVINIVLAFLTKKFSFLSNI